MVTLDQLKKWAEENRPLALTVCQARAFAECEGERVRAYIKPIFDRYGFQYGPLGKQCGLVGKVTNPDNLYLCEDDERIAEYYEECDKAHREHGFDGPHGHCPALTADHLRFQAENVLIDSALPMLGLDDRPFLEKRQQLLNLLLGACLTDYKPVAHY